MADSRSILRFFKFVQGRFDLQGDMAREDEIQTEIWNAVELKGTNLWVLIFAIIIASVGLNTNSTAVIIGAMLISPLMGPLIGLGFGLGVHDFELMTKSARSLFFAMLTSLAVSTLYFLLSPLGEAQSEILARTNPTIWDVIIAFSGGMAGMIAHTRRSKGNVIPGVAIATALMPPLCTAGYGIATFQPKFFLGAFYLFFINSIFITAGTLFIIRFLKFKAIEFKSPDLKKKIDLYILVTLIVTLLPSVYLAYRIVNNELIEQRIRRFIENEVKTKGTVVLEKRIENRGTRSVIKLMILSPKPETQNITKLSETLRYYDLRSFDLEINEFNAQTDAQTVKTEIMKEVVKKYGPDAATLLKNELTKKSIGSREQEDIKKLNEIREELRIQLDGTISVHLAFEVPETTSPSEQDIDDKETRALLVAIKSQKVTSRAVKQKISEWLQVRTKSSSVKILWE